MTQQQKVTEEQIWYTEDWSKGFLIGLKSDPNTGYRAFIWFDYTRHLFNEIREGSLVAVRNFRDRPDNDSERDPAYEEYSILQIDKVHPWHYAIQMDERSYPGFAIAAARNASRDWVEMDEINEDEVARIRCEAIPLRLAFTWDGKGEPKIFFDRSKPMPGFEVHLLSPEMMERILNRDISEAESFIVGDHVVQPKVKIRVRKDDLTRLHFGVFGYTGSGKSNLVSTLVHNLLQAPPEATPEQVYRVVLADLMDEYTGLLIDALVDYEDSLLVVAGRRTLTEGVYQAAITAAQARQGNNKKEKWAEVWKAAQDWGQRLTLPRELKKDAEAFTLPLAKLLWHGKVRFYESGESQGLDFDFTLDSYLREMGPKAYGKKDETNRRKEILRQELQPLIKKAQEAKGRERDNILEQIKTKLRQEIKNYGKFLTKTGYEQLEKAIQHLTRLQGSRGALDTRVAITPFKLVQLLNRRNNPKPFLVVVIGEHEQAIAEFMRQLVQQIFEARRKQSILFPTVSFIFDEADVFIGQKQDKDVSLVAEATLLARRGRKFGLGLGISTQRVRYLNTSIMAQPHTYFISKLPRYSDREAVAQAFAIADETLEQTFSFTVGQWLLVSHDATGLRSVPFPVQLPNANDRIRKWLKRTQNAQAGSRP